MAPDFIYLSAPLPLLVLGAGLTLVLSSRAPRLGRFFPAVVASLALLAGLPLLTRAPQRLIVSAWTQDPLSPLALSLQYDALSVSFLLIILLIVTASHLRKPAGTGTAAVLLLAAAGAAFVLAGDPLTLYLAWALMDLAIFATIYAQTAQRDLDRAVRALGVNVVLGLPLLVVAVTAGPGAEWTHDPGQTWPALAIAALLFAACARLGVYPAPFRYPGSRSRDALRRPPLELVPVTGGAYLLLRVLFLLGLPAEIDAPGVIALGSFWIGVAGLAVAAGGLLAWCEDEARTALRWVMVLQAGLLLLTAGLEDLARAVPVLQAFTLCIAPALMYLWLALDLRPATRPGVLWTRGLGWLAVANLLGIPPTLGFVARWALYRHLVEGGEWPVVILVSAATALTVPPLLRLMRARDGQRRPRGSWPSVTGTSLVGLVLLLVGLQPLLLLGPMQMLMGTASAYLGQVIRGTSSIVGLEVVLALSIPILAGYGLATLVSHDVTVSGEVEEARARQQDGLDSREEAQVRLRQWLGAALSLAWTYEVVERGAWRLGTLIRTLMAPLEGERYWGWTLFFALLVALIVLSG